MESADNSNQVRGRLSRSPEVVAVGQAPEGAEPYAPSQEEHQKGIRAAAEANAATAADEFLRLMRQGQKHGR